MLRKVRELYGFAVRATGGDVAWVHDLYFDDEDWRVGYLVVDAGWWLSRRRVLISPSVLEATVWERQVIPVTLTREQVENTHTFSN